MLLRRNYAGLGVYVLHGDADATVPVAQARHMRQSLAEFHGNWAYHERPGAGHWWGNECMDWPPLFDFLRQNVRRRPAGSISFVTVNPGVSSRCGWLEVVQQELALEPSEVTASCTTSPAAVTLHTDNIRRLAIDVAASGLDPTGSIAITVDGDELQAPPSARIWLHRLPGAGWRITEAVAPGEKTPQRCGPFRDAFRNRMLLVVGTRGSAAANAWALAKARFDAETFWYRGNGGVDVVRDADLAAADHHGRNLILYGNRDTNAAWDDALRGCPIEVGNGALQVGDQRLTGGDLACLFVYPRAGSDTASVGVVAGTGLAGMRLTDRLPYFVSGVHYPDWTVLGADMLRDGIEGVRGAGFFAADWRLDPQQTAWRTEVR